MEKSSLNELQDKNQHRTGRRGSVKAALSLLVLAATVTTAGGCTMFNNVGQIFRYDDTWNSAVAGYRNHTFSAKSWHRHKHIYCNEPCMSDFCAGYRQGYEDVANGGNGCTPAFPPREYWGWQYQSAYGQKRVAAWFAGYPHGAKAAEEEGLGNWSQIQMSSGLQSEYVNAGVLPNRGGVAVYPIQDTVDRLPAAGPIGAPGAAPQLVDPIVQPPVAVPVPLQPLQ